MIAGWTTLYRVLDIRGCPEPQGGVMQQQVRRFTDTHLRGGDRLVRYSAVYGAYAGSDSRPPGHKSCPCRLAGQGRSLLRREIVGSNPTRDAMGSNSTGVQRAVFQAAIGRFDSAGPTKVSGFKLNWRSTRLLTERTGFDSLGAHQVVPG